MSGVSVELDLHGLSQLKTRINRIASSRHFNALMDAVGATIESQTRRRIEEEKQSPSGDPWASWSPSYQRSRHQGHSLLMNQGDLADSIQFFVVGDEVHVGSNLVYAAIHQFGGDGVGKPELPARPFLGVSDENLNDLADIINDFADRLLGL